MPASPAAEHKSRRPALADLAFIGVLRTADFLIHDMDETLRPADLSLTQYNVLRILRGAGPAGLACSEIAGRMLTRDPDITRLLDRLEARGLASRERGRDDRRVVKTRITGKGVRILRELDAPVAQAHRRQLRHLSPAQMRALVKLLDRARGGPVAKAK